MKATKLKSGNYHVLVYCGKDSSGKEIRKSFTGPDKVKLLADAAAWKNDHRVVSGSSTSFSDAMDSFFRIRQTSLSPSTLRGYRCVERVLRKDHPAFCNSNCYNISSEELQRLIDAWIRSGSSPKTAKNRIGFITAVLGQKGIRCPLVHLPQVPVPDLNIPDSDTIRQTLAAAEKYDPEMWICIMLAATGPLRRGEIAALTMDDIDFDNNIVHVHHSKVLGEDNEWHVKVPKTKSSDRYIVMPKKLIDRIKERGYITHWVPTSINERFTRMLEREGIPPYRFHDLRHFCISELISAGIEDIFITERTGHSSLGTMERYKHVLGNRRKKVNRKIMSDFNAFS
jgi:integrase